MKCGDILLLNYPFTDDSSAKVRPALVVSADQFNRGTDIVIVPISSAPNPADPYVFPIRDTDRHFKATRLRKTSFVKWTKPLTVSKSLAQRRLGRLVAGPLSQVQSKLRSLFDD